MEAEKNPFDVMIGEGVRLAISNAIADAVKDDDFIKASLSKAAHLAALNQKKMLTEKEVEDAYEISASRLAKWRFAGEGPDYMKVGKSILYTHKSILDYIDNTKIKISAKR